MLNSIKIIKNRSDIGAGTRGSDMGVDAIEIAAINKANNYFGQYEFVDVDTEKTNTEWYDVVWHSGDRLYSAQTIKAVEIQSSTGTLRANVVHSKDGKVELTAASSVQYNSTENSIDFIIG